MNNQTMQKSKHTPGPWIAESGSSVSFVVKAGDKRSVAAIAGTINREVEEKRANARLIAAAPELLAACKFVFHAIDPQSGLLAQAKCIELLTAAIAKAEGK